MNFHPMWIIGHRVIDKGGQGGLSQWWKPSIQQLEDTTGITGIHLPYWPDYTVFNIHEISCFIVLFYLCDIDDDVTGGVDNEKEMIKVRQGVGPGWPVHDVSKPKHLQNKTL